MSDFSAVFDKIPISIKGVHHKSKYSVIESTDSHYYLVLKKDKVDKDLILYLKSLSIVNSPLYEIGEFEIYPYFFQNISSYPLVDALCLLQNKTIVVERLSHSTKSIIYQELTNQIQNYIHYYEEIQNHIESFSFPKIDYYCFLQNISLFYKSLSLAQYYLDQWNRSNDFSFRKVFSLHNVSNDTVFYFNNQLCFFDYHFGSFDYFFYDFVSYIQREWFSLNLESIWKLYQEKMNLSLAEKNLLYCFLLLIKPISFTDSTYSNTVSIYYSLEYFDLIFRFLSKENENNKETDEKVF